MFQTIPNEKYHTNENAQLSETRKKNENVVDKKKEDKISKKIDGSAQHEIETVNNKLYNKKLPMLSENNETKYNRRLQPTLLDTKKSEQEVIKKKLYTVGVYKPVIFKVALNRF